MITAPFSTAADGIAREAALLQRGKLALMLWQAAENALVVPVAVARRDGMQRALGEAAERGWPVTVRGSGGGIVPQGSATLNLAMVLPCTAGFTVEDGYRMICGAVTEALTRFDITAETGARPGAFCDGAWNVLAGGRKLAGTAQRWRTPTRERVVLAHAAILVRTPQPDLWPVLRQLQAAAFAAEPPLRTGAHIALDALLPGSMGQSAFPGALIRAAEDRLTALTRREKQAA
ncbi:biotin/lipoate A/B protein ligase family protein [Phaeobacter inhibens]|uniref:lipoate--protein ligase family protein n=1 Tax=Phaeobacter inhibens TaxID=221822 RepID=UPI000C99E917|nr:lipoate--protein ligase [Phaeobacter inhibens]AUQ68385.1 Octanoyl-[GcvH]:protein N-octanoyltransferase [Phaeobacter inhibens]